MAIQYGTISVELSVSVCLRISVSCWCTLYGDAVLLCLWTASWHK